MRLRTGLLPVALLVHAGLVWGGVADPEVVLLWTATSNPGAGGVYSDTIRARAGDQLELGVFIRPGSLGVSRYDFSIAYDEELADALDLLSFDHTPPPGWTETGAGIVQESDTTQPGQIQNVAAQGPPLFEGDEFLVTSSLYLYRPSEDPEFLRPLPSSQLLDASGLFADATLKGAVVEEQPPQFYTPRFSGSLPTYPYQPDLGDVRVRTGRLGPLMGPRGSRGMLFTSRAEDGSGFVSTLVPIADAVSFEFFAQILVGDLERSGGFAGAEVDSPAVAPGTVPPSFLFAGVTRENDGTVTAFASDTGTNVGTPVNLGFLDAVDVSFVWTEDRFSVAAGPVGGPPMDVLVDHTFSFDTSATLGIGVDGLGKGDRIGFPFGMSGDLYDDDTKRVLDEVDRLQQLFDTGLADLTKRLGSLEAAVALLERGRPIPCTEPPARTDPLIEDVIFGSGAEPWQRAARKRLEKAARRANKALRGIEKGKAPEKVAKRIEKAVDETARAQQILETRSKKEGKGKL